MIILKRYSWVRKWVTENPCPLLCVVVLVDLWEDLKDNWSPGNLEGDFYSIVAYSRGKAMWVTAT